MMAYVGKHHLISLIPHGLSACVFRFGHVVVSSGPLICTPNRPKRRFRSDMSPLGLARLPTFGKNTL
ncbi:unnamed protein product [Protopolystoma xenopodis]|uniref:Uncharacterized protein n=1 Tax=Protopolystoma xenopodis TaxID=117903 RepID=A0A448WB16_9PLAT|nr:unnamed protein product [Protopolystoma xenopodis]